MAGNLPKVLSEPFAVGDTVVARLVLDLTIYLTGPSEGELDALIDLYEQLCPKDRFSRYTITEMQGWWDVRRPMLTQSGRDAAAAGAKRPYLEPVRKRIREGRRFEVGVWDGRAIDDPEGSWVFSCHRTHSKQLGLRTFARIVAPLTTDPELLLGAARQAADLVTFHSGHGGFAFTYAPFKLHEAFDEIYRRARRFWGVDIEHLNGTLPVSNRGVKAVSWLTLVGNEFASRAEVTPNLTALVSTPGIVAERRGNGLLLVAGPRPTAGDQNRPDGTLAAYEVVARGLAPIFLTSHPEFPGGSFDDKNTVGWLRRFIEPDGWR